MERYVSQSLPSFMVLNHREFYLRRYQVYRPASKKLFSRFLAQSSDNGSIGTWTED